LLDASCRGLLFTPETGAAAEPVTREMLNAQVMWDETIEIANSPGSIKVLLKPR
jgi:hypothetical protein